MAIRKSPHPERARSAQSKGADCTSQRTFQFFHALESGHEDKGIAARALTDRRLTRRGLIFCLLLAAFPIAVAPLQAVEPGQTPAQLIAGLGFTDSNVGFVLVDPQAGQILDEKAPDALFLPASVSKLPTVYAAEQILGAGYRFPTLLLRHGADLYLQGGGDPVLTANDLETLAGQLPRANGNAASGRFFYDDGLMPSLPETNDRQPVAAVYNAGIGALDVNFNRIEVTWSRRNPDGRLEFRATSVADGLIVPTDWVDFAPAAGDLSPEMPFLYVGDGRADHWQYSARLPDQGATFLPVKGSSLHTALIFRQLAMLAGTNLPAPEPGRAPSDADIIARIESRPLADIIPGLLHYSNNVSAELIGLAATRHLTGRALSLSESSRTLNAWLEARLPGVDWHGFRLENHSGLSPQSRVSPRQMASLLVLIGADPLLADSLPTLGHAGVTPAAGNGPPERLLTGKSGTMDYASGLVGYLAAGDGRPLAFAIFVFDRSRRAALDATFDGRILEPTLQARDWTRRARALEAALLKRWMAKF
jgi:D-alanyl-D-alanine carboxypeptidase/D-alanyl-D-alanine-endopeptidase (penicillin-binding protein 4)